MEIKVSDSIGFCFGVKRAIGLAKSELRGKRKIYSIGPIIHNQKVVDELSKEGLSAVKDLDNIKKGGLFLIPSHGVGPRLLKKAKDRGLRSVNTTCPFVEKNQRLVKTLSKKGYRILIVGEDFHPEVKALLDYAEGKAEVITGKEEAKKLDLANVKASVIAQTTQSRKQYLDLVSILLDKDYKELRIFNTICRETGKRQSDTERLAEETELVLVIGGRNSANTSRLVRICRDMGKEVHHIEDADELEPEWVTNKERIGIASGTSTPDWIVQGVIDKLSKLKTQNAKVKTEVKEAVI